MSLKIEKTKSPKQKYSNSEQLGFGKIFTDHMLIIDYDKENGWHDERIVPYQDICLDPSAMVFHYGQTVFEGLKAYKNNGKVYLFRPQENLKRLNKSNDRLCIPQIDEEKVLEYLYKFVDLERDWIPEDEGCSLYIRPFIIATDEQLGVHVSNEYKFIVIASPSGSYYKNGLSPVSIYVEKDYVRAVRGGMGMAKTGGNYAASMKSQDIAHEKGYSQVLWLDGVERKYIEEVGAMNIFFVLKDKVITPMINGSILEGITRKSVIELLRNEGMEVSEERISIDDIVKYYKNGELLEIFGTGTAAVISPVGKLLYDEYEMVVNDGKIGKISLHVYETLTNLQFGKIKDDFNWRVEI
ncbi:MAG: branched-chain amino acid aminotransferase [Finegoldia magna]|uniref:branched-chain amino acid aminotransferase n=1 Tax=Finegoldia magna TaxID=1260 RepID=UPI00290A39F9|nr:branched-chain amino acid aminotransferase [Finegoldia magna]MDU5526116.1 branched-chain amino acid aminotransferase [Finegoldia magna]